MREIIEIGSQIKGRLTGLGGRLGVGGIEQERKRTHKHGQQCGDCGGEGSMGGNGNGKSKK